MCLCMNKKNTVNDYNVCQACTMCIPSLDVISNQKVNIY